MDLNQFYFKHQISLMQAAGATSELARMKHLDAAEVVGGQIFDFLTSRGAAASASWTACPEGAVSA
ncbi:hypothetical protein BV98_003312 [Sphingobium herbicidovorans NBRC 16415]|uniref:Uncharacterized protein n=1 Tax=Sphingobium herbicidovorans (strain ATCC 700291 / DSM 11019 / CCUG 56400 / KCTC 2939 / LMG 18315 / NBRC 16415 / MH) TaxID=1219045 RepID=A0A086P694_SPHHM|nr:hypothetical protein [Sphingobium herbicidovorans]KFG88912.1 hypothetical protein BV98_003312 [Sphingobium herbicidovorans NBRC 16415]